ncbi:MAG TPA: STAS/SEC14 domain-containing protein, partial [Leeuwenhoekiella sp.]|nr:STAS/SEC14 domain-containing protein [Leeuwenhoekiella sp.]
HIKFFSPEEKHLAKEWMEKGNH